MKLAGRKATLIYIIIEKSVISQGPGYFINVSGFCLFVCLWWCLFLGSSVSGAPSGEFITNQLSFRYFQLGPAGVVVIVAGCSSDGVLFHTG